jgi:nucleoid-associated protein YgaU
VEDARAKIAELEGKLKVARNEPGKAAPPVLVAAPILNVVKDTPDGRMDVPVGAASNSQPAAAPTIETTATEPVAPAAPVVEAATVEPAAPAVAADREHVIVSGDTLWKIAKIYYPKQITAGIEKIKKANLDTLPEGKPLKIGTKIKIPAN